ncbi:MAG: diheme cytochrome c [Epsilonproteobacteria bacterium]|nr:diheme cytochrome c [Campylobacterota bacterium]
MRSLLVVMVLLGGLYGDDFRMPKTTNSLYQKECGSCHMVFLPSMLNQDGWKKMMSTLENHFKTDASLDSQDTKKITEYLVQNSSNNLRNPQVVIAISQMPWFVKEHRRISQKTLSHEKIKTISNCVACHTQALKGDYDEDSIKIPGRSWFND